MSVNSRVLKTVSENSKDGKTWGMWIIQYFDPEQGNKNIAVKVITGEKKLKDDGSIWYVAKGMGVKDFEKFKSDYPAFKKMSDNPPAVATMPTSTDEIEEVPF
jgi:hypothetical protein